MMLAGLVRQCDHVDGDDHDHEGMDQNRDICCCWQAVDARMKKLRSKITAQEKAAGGIREDVEVNISRLCCTLACILLVFSILIV